MKRPQAISVYMTITCDAQEAHDCEDLLDADLWVYETADPTKRRQVMLEHAQHQGWRVLGIDDPDAAVAICEPCVKERASVPVA